LVADVSGQNIGPIFKSQAGQHDFLCCLALEDGTDVLSRNVDKQLPPTNLLPQQREGHNCDFASCQYNLVVKNIVVNSFRMCKAFAMLRRILCDPVKAVTLHQVTSCSLHVSVAYTHQGWSPVQVIRSVALVFVFL